MILIFSEENDISTTLVCKWLLYYNSDFLRINVETPVKIEINEGIRIIYKETSISISEVTFFWFRRGGLLIESYVKSSEEVKFLNKNRFIQSFINEEHQRLEEYFFYSLITTCNNYLGNPFVTGMNKLITNQVALKFGLKIPDFYVSSNSKYIPKKFNKGIVKPISEVPHGIINGKYVHVLNHLYEEFDTENLIHIQEFIEKDLTSV